MTAQSTCPPKLALALVRAQRVARAVGKDGKNDHHQYRYATAESMIDEARLTLSGEGLALVQLDVELLDRPPRLRAGYLLVHESGEAWGFSREWYVIEGKGRPLDKAHGGALTTALAYAIRDVLLLPRDDDLAAMDRRDDRAYEPDAQAPARTEAAPQREERPPAAQPAQAERPTPAPTPPPASGDPYAKIVAAIAEGKVTAEALEAAVAQTGLPAPAAESLRFILAGYQARDVGGFAKVGADVRKSQLSKPFQDVTLEHLRGAWTQLQARKAAS